MQVLHHQFSRIFIGFENLVSRRKPVHLCIVILGMIMICVSSIILGDQSSWITRAIKFLACPIVFLYLSAVAAGDGQREGDINPAFYRSAIFAVSLIYLGCIYSLEWMKFEAANYEFFDFGLYANRILRLSQSNFFDALEIANREGHFQPILLFFWAFGLVSPEKILLVGTIVIVSSVVPIIGISKCLGLQRKIGLYAILIFLVYPPVSFVNILGFHPEIFLITFYLFLFYFFEIKKFKFSLFVSGLIFCCGEQYLPSLILVWALLGFNYFGVKRAVLVMLFILLSCTLLFLFASSMQFKNDVIFILANAGSPYSYLSMNADPEVFFRQFDAPRKIVFLALLFGPFIWIFDWRVLSVGAFELLKLLLSSERYHFSLEGHYTVVLIPVIIFSLLKGIEKFPIEQRFLNLKNSLAIVFGLSFGHSALPGTLNFWTNWSAGTYNLAKYQSSEREEELDELVALMDLEDRPLVLVTNGVVNKKLVQNSTLRFLHAGEKFELAKYAIAEESDLPLGAGGHSAETSYNGFLSGFRAQPENKSFFVKHKGDFFILFERK